MKNYQQQKIKQINMIFSAILILLSIAMDPVFGSMEDILGQPGTLRHRQLKCTKKGQACTPALDCCGKAECGLPAGGGTLDVCCLPIDVNGCALDTDCCAGLVCLVASSLCVADPNIVPEDPRACFIHGEDCTNDPSGGDDCCGEQKYMCEVVLGSFPQTKCCIPLWNKGCGQDSHCCGSTDTYIQCIESTCVEIGQDPPEDAKGTRPCAQRGDSCNLKDDRCGSKRLDCVANICCIMDGISGCDGNEDCCSSLCDTVTATCQSSP